MQVLQSWGLLLIGLDTCGSILFLLFLLLLLLFWIFSCSIFHLLLHGATADRCKRFLHVAALENLSHFNWKQGYMLPLILAKKTMSGQET